MLIDYSLFFNEKELLELRFNVLNGYVDKFVIVEGNKTFSGNSKPFILKDVIEELGLPKDKIQVIEVDIPETENIQIEPFDRDTQYPGDRDHFDSIVATSRERITRNALSTILDQFSDDDQFILNDIDELLNPNYISFATMLAKNNPDVIYKFPLINLYGEADLRPYFKNGDPLIWRTALSIVSKKQLMICTPNQIRAQYNVPMQIVNPTIDGKIFDEFGWHFSWMGGSDRVLLKSLSYGHAPNKAHIEQRDKGFKFEQNRSLTWDENTILIKIPHKMLPKHIFKLPRVLKFLLPNYENIV